VVDVLHTKMAGSRFQMSLHDSRKGSSFLGCSGLNLIDLFPIGAY